MEQGTRIVLACALSIVVAEAAHAQPSGAHPRIWLDAGVVSAWQGMQNDPASPVARAIDTCTDAHDNPSDYADGEYQGFAWVEALGACLVAFATTNDAEHRDTAIVYLSALLDDRETVGDGNGPSYNGGVGIVSQDTGYSMRTHGVWAALGYDWLYDHLTPARRDSAHARFVQWLAFHDEADTYMRAQPGANYHAGHVLAVTLIAIGHGHEMNTYASGSGTALYDYVTDEMWGEVMANGYSPRGTLLGGDWLEGYQYAPLSLVSYSLAGRALVEQGETIAWLDDYQADVFHRYLHGLSPSDRAFVGGDTDDESPLIEPSALPLYGIIAGVASPAIKAQAQAELARLALDEPDDFRLLFEALAAAEQVAPAPIDRASLPRAFLAEGAGNFYGRTRFDANATWFASQCRGGVVDHQHMNAGNVVLSRGADDLLVDPGPYGSLSTLTGNAPTMSQPHFADNYQPSQGAFGESWGGELVPANEATRFLFARGTASNVLVSRCDLTGQFRFRDVPSSIVSSATRDVVVLPGESGASMLLVDRMLTTAAYASDANPMLMRFHGLGAFRTDRRGARALSERGSSKLTVRRIFGDASVETGATREGDCGGDRGKCESARFPAFEARVEVEGPSPMTMHLLDADASSADVYVAEVHEAGQVLVARIDRDARRYDVVATRDGSAVSTYRVPAIGSTEVVLDPPPGARVSATATRVGDECEITLSTAVSGGFESEPLVLALDASCAVSEDSGSPPMRPAGIGGVVDAPFGEGGGGGGGCGCGVPHERVPYPLGVIACVGLLLLRRTLIGRGLRVGRSGSEPVRARRGGRA